MAEDTFKLPGSSYEELTKIIKAYASSKDTSPAAVGQLAGVDQTQVSRNNGFLISAGLIEGKMKKSVTPVGESLGRALEHGVEDEVRRTWANIVKDSDFLDRIVAAVRIRKGMDPNSLRSHIAYTAGQKKSGTVMAGAGALIEILRFAGALTEEDGKLVVGDTLRSPEESPESSDSGTPSPGHAPRMQSVEGTAGVSVTVEVSVSATVDELPQLGINLRKLMKELAKPDEDDGTGN